MSSGNLTLFTTRVLPSRILQLLSFTWSITRSRCAMNSSDESGSPCRVPTSVWNYSPWCLLIPTADWVSLYIFCSNVTSFSSLVYDLSAAHMTSCLIVPKAFWKSMKQLYIFFLCLLAFSTISEVLRFDVQYFYTFWILLIILNGEVLTAVWVCWIVRLVVFFLHGWWRRLFCRLHTD